MYMQPLYTLFFFSFLCSVLVSCHTPPDLPQHLAGTEVIAFVSAPKDTIFIRNKAYIRAIAKQLAYMERVPSSPTLSGSYVRFFRQGSRYTLLEGRLSVDFQTLTFSHKGTLYTCKIGKDAQKILQQARKYPTLLQH
jgi:hypothetical protein